MPFPKKKKPKKTSPQLDYLQKQREQEWEDAMKKKIRSPYPTQEEKDKMRELREKYGIKEQREQS